MAIQGANRDNSWTICVQFTSTQYIYPQTQKELPDIFRQSDSLANLRFVNALQIENHGEGGSHLLHALSPSLSACCTVSERRLT